MLNSDIILEEMQRVVDKAKLNKDAGVDNSKYVEYSVLFISKVLPVY